MNHYVIDGIVPMVVSDPKQISGGTSDYDVSITHTFLNGLIQAITFGIYIQTTNVVKK